MIAYLDSSFLFSLYVQDEHSASATARLGTFAGELVMTTLTELEVLNSFQGRVFRNQMSSSEAEKLLVTFQNDIRNGCFRIIDLEEPVFLQAKTLIAETTPIIGCRTADILHVAAALECEADVLFTFDDRQKALARRFKLKTN